MTPENRDSTTTRVMLYSRGFIDSPDILNGLSISWQDKPLLVQQTHWARKQYMPAKGIYVTVYLSTQARELLLTKHYINL